MKPFMKLLRMFHVNSNNSFIHEINSINEVSQLNCPAIIKKLSDDLFQCLLMYKQQSLLLLVMSTKIGDFEYFTKFVDLFHSLGTTC